ncbi:MAG: metallophosphoesterase [Proteobacteria bacterium]|uniref:metallophosphoesterase n=1 Tax=Aquabacterium sp. TaxID=1872578 RepID=UPI0035C73797|nr:metallophosphoesterase [Pseudomonadota bacterium]
MRLQLASDLHLERYPDFVLPADPQADVLVLAGDIGSYQAGSRLPDADFGLGQFSPLRPGSPWKRVLFVPGNHEFDGLEFADTHPRLRATCERLGLTWLDGEVVVIEGVRFVGSTLWSDFSALAARERGVTAQMAALDKALRAANFYLRKNSTLRGGQHLLAEDLRPLALQCQDRLRQALQQPFEGPTVAVTHFAPTLHSADPRYGLTPGTAGFCNGLDELLPHADLWLHGHLHCPNDHTVRGTRADGSAWACRIVANPRGYFSKGEQASFVPQCVLTVPASGSDAPQRKVASGVPAYTHPVIHPSARMGPDLP